MFTTVPLQGDLSVANFVFAICMGLVLLSFFWSLCVSLRQGWTNLQQLHQMPCDRCVFFTGEYHVKCALHPYKALSVEAINCLEYESAAMSSRQMATRR